MKEYSDQRVFIEFEGVMTDCSIYVNGTKAGEHYGGYMGFEIDITDLVHTGNNLLAVRVSAEPDPLTPPGKPQGNMDFYYYSGIYRDVNLVLKNPVHITSPLSGDDTAGGGIFIRWEDISREKATAEITSTIRNAGTDKAEGSIIQELLDEKGKVVASAKKEYTLEGGTSTCLTHPLSVDSPLLWHPYEPNLYTLRTRLESFPGQFILQTQNRDI